VREPSNLIAAAFPHSSGGAGGDRGGVGVHRELAGGIGRLAGEALSAPGSSLAASRLGCPAIDYREQVTALAGVASSAIWSVAPAASTSSAAASSSRCVASGSLRARSR
jgi:hypothetical protein